MAKVTATQILKDAAELKEQKSKDYQGGKWSEQDYFPFGDQSYMHMIHTKYLRMRNIMETKNPNFESLEDTLIDMINYCAMYAAWLENKKMDGERPLTNSNNLTEAELQKARQLWDLQKKI